MAIKTALVTGAAQGIGAKIAEELCAAGYRVVGVDRHDFTIEGVETAICDLADEAAIDSLASSIKRLDLLINNAAISANGDPRFVSLEDWNRVLAVNLTAPFLLSRLFADKLRYREGAIVNIASTRALMSEPFTEGYSASKGGILALTHAMAMSLAPVRVNAISPGWIEHREIESLREVDHSFHPAGRVGRVEDIAKAVVFLASAEFITGENLIIDGGVTRKMIYPS
ncbi:oxidoreductase [Campylobacterota bacterium]|nr:oxidoreductase [Campylobacterota bacterium]